MVLKLKAKVEVFKSIFEPVRTLVNEVKLVLTENGLAMKAVDPSHIAMIDMTVDKSVFETFEATRCELGVNLQYLFESLRVIKAESDVEVEHMEETNKLQIKFSNGKRTNALIDASALTDPKMPALTPSTKFEIHLSDLQAAFKTVGDVFELISVEVNKDGVLIESKSEANAGEWFIPMADLVSVDAPEKVRSSYAKDYFSMMMKGIIGVDSVKCAMGKDYPIIVDYDANGIKVKYLLAPRIEND